MSVHPTQPQAPGVVSDPRARTSAPGIGHYIHKVLKPLASLQLTVVLFALGMLLVFFGTLAQMDYGIWTVVDKYFWSWFVMVPFELFHKFLGVFWKEQFPPDSSPWSGAFPFPAGKLLGGLMLINLLAAHAIRFRLTWKRAGIFLIHSGLILLFVGEFITREFAIEQQMTIDEGSSTNFTIDTRNVELAFVDRSSPTEDKYTVISQRRLRAAAQSGERIRHPDLPVDVEVVKYMKNSDLRDVGPGLENPATAGFGKMVVAVEAKEEAGVETKQRGDVASAYVRFYHKETGEDLGCYLVSLYISAQGHADKIRVGEKEYEVLLRQARYYKPYRVHLDEFRFDRYIGTNKPKNYSSDVRVYDAEGNLVRETRIAMNEPMRYAGETFYQADFDKETEKTTILQVVKNPGWIDLWFFQASVDYIACALVGIGLVLHFSIYLIQFLLRQPTSRSARVEATVSTAAPPETNPTPHSPVTLSRIFPWVMLAVAGFFLLSVYGRMTPRSHKEPYDVDSFARIPVIEGGRVKPLETVARVYMRLISHRETFVDENGTTQPAIRWYLDVIAAPSMDDNSPAWHHRVFRIENDQIRRDWKLEQREGLRYSYAELRPHLADLERRVFTARSKARAKKPLDLAESKLIELEERIEMVRSLHQLKGLNSQGKDTLRLIPPHDDQSWASLGAIRDAADLAGLRAAQEALQKHKQRLFQLPDEVNRRIVKLVARLDLDQVDERNQVELLVRVVRLMQTPVDEIPADFLASILPNLLEATLLALPADEAARLRAAIDNDYHHRIAASPAASLWLRMIHAYRDNKPIEFNKAVAEYHDTQLDGISTADLLRTRVEVVYNRFAPFYQCTGLYVLGFVLAIVGFVLYAAESPPWAVALRRSATLVLLLTLLVHTAALIARMYIMERWGVFVTNLYSSAIFIGWGCVALCLILERIFPIGVGNVVAAILGLATSIVAHNLGTQDTLEMMEAVLDTNFWLATHVTTVTLGYTATFVAGFLGAVYVLMMLGAVIRDSFRNTREPTSGELVAFGAAAVGVVGLPLALVWFITGALEKFEVLPSTVLQGIYYLALATGIIYAFTLMLLRITHTTGPASGQSPAGALPGLVQPIAALGLTPESSKILGQMIYGVVCFATLLSFVGTVLGGIWADQSWGRFWGWDPKENGAVLIVLWNALILHARWAGLVKERGVAVLAIFGNIVTAWSWFGTNQLGIGLHAYGFDSRLADGCFNFWASQLFILGLGFIPRQFWSQSLTITRLPAAASLPGGVAASGSGGPAGGVSEHSGNGPARRDHEKRAGKRR
ncbi:MAG: cytochrome c biogenesis protein ResB [Gemmataceae bacterium]|nr:cytochrome c biogenesis protein ResB [Gemmata sp.]MDW8197768.1 cytochrome c biogenesis protein ResB [Gemmataceae bacterium]